MAWHWSQPISRSSLTRTSYYTYVRTLRPGVRTGTLTASPLGGQKVVRSKSRNKRFIYFKKSTTLVFRCLDSDGVGDQLKQLARVDGMGVLTRPATIPRRQAYIPGGVIIIFRIIVI